MLGGSLEEEKETPEFLLSVPCEDMVRRWLSACQKEAPHQSLAMLAS